MPRPAPKKDLNLKWLELFQITAEKGSLRAAAKETGLTLSTVSHHLRSLEEHLGVALFNHKRRPMVLTHKGSAFLRNIDEALLMIRKAKAEASAGSLTEASLLRVGTIDELDSDIVPEIAVSLSRHMVDCHFRYQTAASQTIIELLRDRHLDLGVTSAPQDQFKGLEERPLLRDPFVVVAPRTVQTPVAELIAGQSDLAFLRFSSSLLIARQITSQMRRLGLATTSNFESANSQILMAMVAAGAGWTITTPLLYARAKRFHADLTMHKFPAKSFARTLSVVSTPDCSDAVRDLFEAELRKLITRYAIAPQIRDQPWLAGSFELIA